MFYWHQINCFGGLSCCHIYDHISAAGFHITAVFYNIQLVTLARRVDFYCCFSGNWGSAGSGGKSKRDKSFIACRKIFYFFSPLFIFCNSEIGCSSRIAYMNLSYPGSQIVLWIFIWITVCSAIHGDRIAPLRFSFESR